jgi:endonuclease/exonuclease/phosphatase family metal-dependent hydrolase
MHLARRIAVVLTVLVALAAAAASTAAAGGGAVSGRPRHLARGGGVRRPLEAIQGLPPEEQGPAFVAANTTLRAIVDQTNFPLRSQRLAREIAFTQPDLVGLQEVALWRHGPLDGSPATTVDYDFLATLVGDLAAIGQQYEVVHAQQESDVSGPAVLGGSLQNVRLTMRDAILRRVGSGVSVQASGGGNYVTRIPLVVAGQRLAFVRGYAYADVTKGRRQFRFVNTHLESASSDVAYAQAAELLAGPAAPSGKPTVVVCDCNSDPLDSSRKPGERFAHQDPYLLITGAGGFTDQWLRFAPAALGFTSGLSELVNDTPLQALQAFDHRIDMVFGRGADGRSLPVDWGWVTGRNPLNRTDPTPIGRLWPSDHAGVVLDLEP